MKLLIANRGEIARRILKACREKNFSVAVIATAEDKNSLVCQEADAVLEVDSFLNAEQIIQRAQSWGAHLLHPGYGFLSENAPFAELCEKNSIIFIGPTSEQIKMLGSKESSKKIAQECLVPVLPAVLSTELKKISPNAWKNKFETLGIIAPYLVKASGGGGGRGMRIVENFFNLPDILVRASDEALRAFHDPTVFVERYLRHPRHIEAQVFGDGNGGGIFLGERECSLQRRHQKVIEECPSTIMTPTLSEQMARASLSLVHYAKYRGAGTVEFLVDDKNNFYFLEMNTRLQVEHPVTEMVYGVDLVHAQIDLALGKWPFEIPPYIPTQQNAQLHIPKPNGVAIEARILAENPRENFLPTPGKIEAYQEPQMDSSCASNGHIRVDSGVKTGSTILPTFDSMIAKLIVHAPTRAQAIALIKDALKKYQIFGITTNIPFLIALVSRQEFLRGEESTHFIEEHLNELNQNLIPQNTINFFHSYVFREELFSKTKIKNVKSKSSEIFSRQQFRNSSLTSQFTNLETPNYTIFLNSKNLMEVNVEGEILILENPGYYNQNIAQSDDKEFCEIKSPMAGKVYEICVQKDSHIQKGDLLFIIESMKMQLEVRAPQDGKMSEICVHKNDILTGQNVLGMLRQDISRIST